jgi:hypothetical protein
MLLAAVGWFVVRPRLHPPDHPLTLAAPPLPVSMRTAAQRHAWTLAHGRVRSRATLDKVLLVGLLGVVFGTILPGADLGPADLFIWTAILVVANALLSLGAVRRGRAVETVLGAFAARLVLNTILTVVVVRVTGRDLSIVDSLFLVVLFSVVISAYDIVRPVYEARRAAPASGDESLGA